MTHLRSVLSIFLRLFSWHDINQNGATIDPKNVSGGIVEINYCLRGFEFSWTCWILSSICLGLI